MSDYRGIDCDLYDRYELAIMRRRRLLLNWLDEAGLSHLELVQPLDLETRPEGEFLVASAAGEARLLIRLDRILHARDPGTGEEFPVKP